MTHQYEFKIFDMDDIPRVRKFEQDQLELREPDGMKREMLMWSVPWRNESLVHFASLGWSFVVESSDANDKSVIGYCLGQVMPFFRNQTQVLWIEHLNLIETGQTPELAAKMIDMIKRYGRDKHLQSVCISETGLQHVAETVRHEIQRAAKDGGGKFIGGPDGLMEIYVGKSVPKT